MTDNTKHPLSADEYFSEVNTGWYVEENGVKKWRLREYPEHKTTAELLTLFKTSLRA